MGVVARTYLILGVYLPYDNELVDRLIDQEYDTNDEGDLFALADGMGCTYVVVGRVLCKTDPHGGMEDPVPVEINVTDADKELIQSKIKDGLDLDEKVSLFMITHYS